MKKQFLSFLAGMVVFIFSVTQALSATQGRIAAIVNDTVITLTDIKERADLYTGGKTAQSSPDERRKIEQQVLDKLINEALQIQEAKKLGIALAEEELKAGFADVSRQNNTTPEEFRQRLAKAGVSIDSLYDQIRADLSWSQVIRRKLRPRVTISDGEIDLTLSQIAHSSGRTQYRVAEIFLGVRNPAEDGDTLAEAKKMIKQLTEGAAFTSMAREFSQAPGAAQGGDLGWVQEGQLDPELDKALTKMSPGQISPPVRSSKGYHILLLREARQSSTPLVEAAPAPAAEAGPVVALKQIVIPVSDEDPDAIAAAKVARAQSLKNEIKSCDEMAARAKEFDTPGTGDIGKGPQSSLPEELRVIVEKLAVHELSDPIRSPAGLVLVMVCSRETAPEKTSESVIPLPKLDASQNDPASREKIANKIGTQRLTQMAERYLRDLRATAFIDKRL